LRFVYVFRRPSANELVALGILVGMAFLQHGPTRGAPTPREECPGALPLDPIHRHPLLPGDSLLRSAEKELDRRVREKLKGTESAVVLVVHGGSTILEWSHGRVRSNVSSEEDDRKVDADTIWRVASITKVITS
jgi:CubicO group peptidase (beta-lactamase class C family)